MVELAGVDVKVVNYDIVVIYTLTPVVTLSMSYPLASVVNTENEDVAPRVAGFERPVIEIVNGVPVEE